MTATATATATADKDKWDEAEVEAEEEEEDDDDEDEDDEVVCWSNGWLLVCLSYKWAKQMDPALSHFTSPSPSPIATFPLHQARVSKDAAP